VFKLKVLDLLKYQTQIGMSHVNTVIDRVYVINLDKDTERLHAFDKQMKKHRISYTRFPAMNGASLAYDEGLTKFCNDFCTPGMKGCALSHKAIWEDMIKNRYENVLIFEDDVTLVDNFETVFRDGWDQLPNDYDVYYLGCHGTCENTDISSKVLNNVLQTHPEDYDKNLKTVQGSLGFHAYIISQKCAKTIVDSPINTHVDLQMILWIKQFNLSAYSISPLVAYVEGQTESNLSDSFPLLLNSALHPVYLFSTIPLDRAVTESWGHIGGYTINLLIVLLSIIILVLPKQFVGVVGLWLLAELIYSRDAKNTWRYAVMLAPASFVSVWFGPFYAYLLPSS